MRWMSELPVQNQQTQGSKEQKEEGPTLSNRGWCLSAREAAPVAAERDGRNDGQTDQAHDDRNDDDHPHPQLCLGSCRGTEMCQ